MVFQPSWVNQVVHVEPGNVVAIGQLESVVAPAEPDRAASRKAHDTSGYSLATRLHRVIWQQRCLAVNGHNQLETLKRLIEETGEGTRQEHLVLFVHRNRNGEEHRRCLGRDSSKTE